jgi:hypothetical protein
MTNKPGDNDDDDDADDIIEQAGAAAQPEPEKQTVEVALTVPPGVSIEISINGVQLDIVEE